MNQVEIDAILEERRAKAKDAFDAWMNDPMTRLTMSMIPPGSNPEALQVLLRAAFNCGNSYGESTILIAVARHMGKLHPRDALPADHQHLTNTEEMKP